jgi:ribosome-associated protein
MNFPEQPTPSGEDIGPGVRARAGAVVIRFARSGGPGGQNVNKLNTKADLRVPLADIEGMPPDAMERLVLLAGWRINTAGELHLTAEIERTQEGNRSAVMGLLRDLIARAMKRPKVRKKTKPTKASKRRRVEQKRRRGEVKRMRGGEA